MSLNTLKTNYRHKISNVKLFMVSEKSSNSKVKWGPTGITALCIHWTPKLETRPCPTQFTRIFTGSMKNVELPFFFFKQSKQKRLKKTNKWKHIKGKEGTCKHTYSLNTYLHIYQYMLCIYSTYTIYMAILYVVHPHPRAISTTPNYFKIQSCGTAGQRGFGHHYF